MAQIKTIVHLVLAPEELPLAAEKQVCALIDVYENQERSNASYRLAYDTLTSEEQQLWDDFVAMIVSKEANNEEEIPNS